METLILMIDTAAIIVVVIYSLRNEKRPGDADEIGPFRLKKLPAAVAPTKAIVPGKRSRSRAL